MHRLLVGGVTVYGPQAVFAQSVDCVQIQFDDGRLNTILLEQPYQHATNRTVADDDGLADQEWNLGPSS